MTERRFKFAWSLTWPDRLHDFIAADGEHQIGRVYKLPSIEEKWKWAMTASIGNPLGSTAGIEDTRDEACDAVERQYEAMKAAVRDLPSAELPSRPANASILAGGGAHGPEKTKGGK